LKKIEENPRNFKKERRKEGKKGKAVTLGERRSRFLKAGAVGSGCGWVGTFTTCSAGALFSRWW
jgi:hypothetical protein